MFNDEELSTNARAAAIYKDIKPYIDIKPEDEEIVLMLIEGNLCVEKEQRYKREREIHLEYAKQFEEMAAKSQEDYDYIKQNIR